MDHESTSTTTVQEYLLGCTMGYPVEEATLKVIVVKRGLLLDDDVYTLTPRERDMLELEMLNMLLYAPMMSQSLEDKNGTWSHKEGAVELNSTDKKNLEKRIKALETQYNIRKSSIQMHNQAMKVWH